MKCQEKGISFEDPQSAKQVSDLAKQSDIRFPSLGQVELDSRNVSELIRNSTITNSISKVASNPTVRNILAEQQRAMARGDTPGATSVGFRHNNTLIQGVVMDGRDIGTVILPDAELKVFIEADARIRAQRRFDELKTRQGDKFKETLEQVLEDLEARDLADRTRKVAPLKKASDAIILDTSHLDIDEQVKAIENMVYERV